MELSRTRLETHLRRVWVEGEFPEAEFGPDLSTTSVTPERLFFVDAPSLGESILPGPLVLCDLNILIQALGLRGQPEVTLQMRNRRLMLDADGGSHSSFLTAEDTGTRASDEERARILGHASAFGGVPVGAELISAVKARRDVFSPTEIRLECRPAGTTFVFGSRRAHFASYVKPDLRTKGEEYDLILPAKTVVRVLKLIPDPEAAEIALTGADSILVIRFAGYSYALNPMAEE